MRDTTARWMPTIRLYRRRFFRTECTHTHTTGVYNQRKWCSTSAQKTSRQTNVVVADISTKRCASFFPVRFIRFYLLLTFASNSNRKRFKSFSIRDTIPEKCKNWRRRSLATHEKNNNDDIDKFSQFVLRSLFAHIECIADEVMERRKQKRT